MLDGSLGPLTIADHNMAVLVLYVLLVGLCVYLLLIDPTDKK